MEVEINGATYPSGFLRVRLLSTHSIQTLARSLETRRLVSVRAVSVPRYRGVGIHSLVHKYICRFDQAADKMAATPRLSSTTGRPINHGFGVPTYYINHIAPRVLSPQYITSLITHLLCVESSKPPNQLKITLVVSASSQVVKFVSSFGKVLGHSDTFTYLSSSLGYERTQISPAQASKSPNRTVLRLVGSTEAAYAIGVFSFFSHHNHHSTSSNVAITGLIFPTPVAVLFSIFIFSGQACFPDALVSACCGSGFGYQYKTTKAGVRILLGTRLPILDSASHNLDAGEGLQSCSGGDDRYCCNKDYDCCSNSTNIFTLDVANIVTTIPYGSSRSTSAPSTAATPTSTGSGGSSSAVAIGAGVGAGVVGFLVILLAIFLILRRKRSKMNGSGQLVSSNIEVDGRLHQATNSNEQFAIPNELELSGEKCGHIPKHPIEMSEKPIYEIGRPRSPLPRILGLSYEVDGNLGHATSAHDALCRRKIMSMLIATADERRTDHKDKQIATQDRHAKYNMLAPHGEQHSDDVPLCPNQRQLMFKKSRVISISLRTSYGAKEAWNRMLCSANVSQDCKIRVE
ncbi:uncharacterized protein BDR25DRAFT_351638 [Lindgomyces ingoldianus]|uniref:Uncharacterized protein n=1 Tax=Lindgomyces ingoldianus TaxID=673940 RepID=A0ACB6R6L2_9PLEO|nr:uncharacterized protein BDR25DRAFT_351638 [Lindgomyces ingoldianus]KAF2474096.1 hypothetical protein BDR25DRAFT_351638 [Lindgomyces ingoldianus]